MDNCTFRSNLANSAAGSGGAIYSAAPVTARNCTIDSGNASKGSGLYLAAGGTLWNCTVANNGSPTATGGGIYGTVTLESTIVSKNNGSSGPDIFGSATAKNCAIGSASGFTFTDQGGNLAFGLDPQFRQVFSGNFGGSVICLPLLANSPCKDKGSNPGGLTDDVRGPGHPRAAGSAPDIGAFEIQPPPQAQVIVNYGQVQRSRVVHLTVILPDTIDYDSNLYELRRASDNSLVTMITEGTVAGPTPGTLSFGRYFGSNGNSLVSLNDGVYVLRVFGTNITDPSGQNLDGNGDGIGGDDYVSPTTPGNPNRIFRFFGDSNGDGSVNANDFIQFRQYFGGYSYVFDFDNDGAVAASDFIQFRMRFGGTI